MEDKPFQLSAVIITYNEEKKLGDCLDSVKFADEIIIVDAHSSDRTKEIANRDKVKFYLRQFDNFSAQKNYGISQAKGKWILLLDADEQVAPSLKSEIKDVIQNRNFYVGYYIKRDNFMFGGWVRHGANAHDYQLRLIRNGAGKFNGLVHERIEVAGQTGKLREHLIHKTYQTLDEYFSKFNLFTSLDAQGLLRQKRTQSWADVFLKPVANFTYFYFFKLGFLDGMPGLIYQILSSFYLFVRNVKAIRNTTHARRSLK